MRLLKPYFTKRRCTQFLSTPVLADSEDVGKRAFQADHDRMKRRQRDTSLVVFQTMQGSGIDADPFCEDAVRQIAALLFQKAGEFLIQNRWCPHLKKVRGKALPMGNTLLDVSYWQRNP